MSAKISESYKQETQRLYEIWRKNSEILVQLWKSPSPDCASIEQASAACDMLWRQYEDRVWIECGLPRNELMNVRAAAQAKERD